MPDLIDTFISPLLVLIIGGLVILLIIQPLGGDSDIRYLYCFDVCI